MLRRNLCLAGWLVALLIEIYYIAQLPAKVMFVGFDVTHDQAAHNAYQLIWIFVGLTSAGVASASKTYANVGILFSSVLYLLWRYGAGAVRHGLVTDFRMKWVAASGLHYEFTFLVQDVILPILFLAVISITIRDYLRRVQTNEDA
jgi:hypothetical protein